MKRCNNCGWSNNPDSCTICEKCGAPLNEYQEPMQQNNNDFNPSKTVREAILDDSPSVSPFSVSNGGGVSEESNMNCINCGYPLRGGALTCPQCGQSAPIDSQSATPLNSHINCPHCGTQNPVGATFCTGCGKSLSVSTGKIKCPNCGKDNDSEAAFCFACGTSLKKRDFNKTVLPSRISKCSLTIVPEEGEEVEALKWNISDESVILNRENTDPGNKTITRDEQAILVFENKKWFIQNKSAMNSTFILAQEKTELKNGDIILLGDRKFEFNF